MKATKDKQFCHDVFFVSGLRHRPSHSPRRGTQPEETHESTEVNYADAQ